jgi:cellulose synthase/poly-beta-1,6-N-acetylglucosamine synthase-like glycosyltransferase
MLLLNVCLTIVASILLVPVAVFCGECGLALLRKRRSQPRPLSDRPSVVVLMPAHNEEVGIGASIKSVAAQLTDRDRLVVIADNCTDHTAAVARELGAVVIERVDADRRGKGYALDFGLRFIQVKPPEVVIVMDADCTPEQGMIDALARQADTTGRPAQAIYLMEHPAQPSARDLVSALAFMVKNQVRPTGVTRLGLPCLLTGTGMAFPWNIIRDAKLASGNIVEDMQLGVDLTLAGRAPRLCETARVTGRLPEHASASAAQRRRWEHGHLQTLLTQVPRLAIRSIFKLNLGAMAIALDLAVPPLSLLVACVLAGSLVMSVAAVLGTSWNPAIALASGAAAIGISVIAAWAKFGRSHLPLRALVAAPF